MLIINCDVLLFIGGSRWMPMPNLSTSASRNGTQSRNSADTSASAASSSSSSATSSSSSSSASGTSQNVGPIPSGVVFPGMPPMSVPPMAMPPGATPADLLPVDPCLPCHSRHFNRRAQMPAGQDAGADQVTVLAFVFQFGSSFNARFSQLCHNLYEYTYKSI